MVYLFKLLVPYMPEFLKFLQHLYYLLQNLEYIPPDFTGILYLNKKKLLALLLFHAYQVCSGSNIIRSMLSIFFSISLIVLFHIASSASSSFRNEFMLPNVSLISFIFPFIMSKTSRISLYLSNVLSFEFFMLSSFIKAPSDFLKSLLTMLMLPRIALNLSTLT